VLLFFHLSEDKPANIFFLAFYILALPLFFNPSFLSFKTFLSFHLFWLSFLYYDPGKIPSSFYFAFLGLLLGSLIVPFKLLGNVNQTLSLAALIFFLLHEKLPGKTSRFPAVFLFLLFLYFRSFLTLFAFLTFYITGKKEKNILLLPLASAFILFFAYAAKNDPHFIGGRFLWFRTTVTAWTGSIFQGCGWGMMRHWLAALLPAAERTLFAHSSFFQMLAEGGTFYIIFLVSFMRGFRIKNLSLLLPLLVLYFFDYFLYVPLWSLFFALGLKSALVPVESKKIPRLYFILPSIFLGLFYIRIFLSDICFAKAGNAVKHGAYENADTLFNKAIRIFPHHLTAWAGKAYIEARNGDYQSAIIHLERAIPVTHGNYPPKRYLSLAEESISGGDISRTEEYLKKSVSFLYLMEDIPE